MRFLVTGGAGFIGSHIATELVRRGHDVRVLDDLSTGNMDNLSHLPSGSFEMIEGTICDFDTCLDAVGAKGRCPVDRVLHQAAIPSVPRSIKAPLATFAANVSGTQNILEACVRGGVGQLVMASSSSVYGGAVPAEEDLPLAPQSPYAAHKAACEQLCAAYGVFGLNAACLRYFNVFGPRQDPDSPYSAVIPAFIRAARAGRPVTIHGDGLQTRDFTYVEDVVAANLFMAERPDISGTFNVGGGRRRCLLDLVRELEACLGIKVGMTYINPRDGDVRDSRAVMDKMHKLGYRTSVGFSLGLYKTVEWFDGQTEAQTQA